MKIFDKIKSMFKHEINPDDDVIRNVEDLRKAVGPDIPIYVVPDGADSDEIAEAIVKMRKLQDEVNDE